MSPQETAQFYLVFGLILAALFFAALAFAFLIVRRDAESKVEGRTALWVVVGVGVTVLASALIIGITNAIYVLSCFAASGIPMIFEYSSRVHSAMSKDRKEADQVAKDMLE